MRCILFVIVSFLRTCYSSKWDDTNMVKLGLQINKTFENPEGEWICLERDAHVYFEELEEILNYIADDDPEGLTVYRQIKEQGGPPHMHCPPDEEKLRKFYECRDNDLRDLRNILHDTEVMWVKICEAAEKKLKEYEMGNVTMRSKKKTTSDFLHILHDEQESDELVKAWLESD